MVTQIDTSSDQFRSPHECSCHSQMKKDDAPPNEKELKEITLDEIAKQSKLDRKKDITLEDIAKQFEISMKLERVNEKE